MFVLVDDIRDLHADIICRNVEAAKAVLGMKITTHLYLDHDLQDRYGFTGYDLVNWMIENDCLPPKISICSSNPVGRQNIQRALDNTGYIYNHTEYQWEKE